MKNENDIHFVAEKARETFLKIKVLRKTMPKFTRSERDALQAEIKKLQDQWWEHVKKLMVRPNLDQ